MNIDQRLKPSGVFTLKHFRGGKQIGEDIVSPNLVVDEGKNYIANTCWNATDTAETLWYLALFGTSTTPAAGWTAATVAGTSGELTTQYSEANRPQWVKNAGNTGASSSNSDSTATFTMASDDTIYGAFMISENTKGGTTGVLLAASLFSASRAVLNGDTLELTYTITLT